MDRIGFLGAGHLATALISGLILSGVPAGTITVSPRGRGPALAEKFGLELAADNEVLVSSCSVLVLAVRPQHAAAAVEGLPWHRGQLLLSACAGVCRDRLMGAAPAEVVRCMPLTAAEYRASPTTLFPDHERARSLLSRLGPVIALDAEDQFEVATVSAAVYGWAQVLIARSVAWSRAQGLPEPLARQLAASTFLAAGRNASDTSRSLDDILAALVTPGGITERGLGVLSGREVPGAWDQACDAVLAKLMG